MTIIAYFNGKTSPLSDLTVPIDDRAYQFGDSVYEVLRVYQKKPFLLSEHMARLNKSLDAMHITVTEDIEKLLLTNVLENQITEGMVYLQISRGTAPRVHSFHGLELSANILIYSKPFRVHPCQDEAERGIVAITHPDIRWGRCDIKTTNLLGNCMAQTKAHEMGAKEAILIRDGLVTEASSSNVFCVKNGVVYTSPLSNNILPGTRRAFVIKALRNYGFMVLEKAVSKDELFFSDEVFITSTIKEAVAVTKIDDFIIGDGRVGKIAALARELMLKDI